MSSQRRFVLAGDGMGSGSCGKGFSTTGSVFGCTSSGIATICPQPGQTVSVPAVSSGTSSARPQEH